MFVCACVRKRERERERDTRYEREGGPGRSPTIKSVQWIYDGGPR